MPTPAGTGIRPHKVVAGAGPIQTLPRIAGGLSRSRRLAGILTAVLGLTLLTIALVPVRSDLAAQSVLMLHLLAVVVVAVVGGVVPARAWTSDWRSPEGSPTPCRRSSPRQTRPGAG